ncbi:hypothetical protein ACF0H5_021648 [Mactra antiquata]
MGGSESRPQTPPPKLLTDTPWRSLKESGETLENTIVQDIKRLGPEKSPGILLLGPVGAGKSSFINSCLSVGIGRKKSIAQTGSDEGSYTLEFKRYKGSDLLKNFRFMDCMGIEGAFGKGFHPNDIIFLLEGHVKRNYKFDQDRPMDKESKFYRPNPTFEEKTHCVVFVIDAKAMNDGIPQAYVDKIKWLQKEIKKADVPRALILTKCDLLCSKVQENVNNIFRSVKVERAVKAASEVFAIDISSIHPVVNYEVDVELSTANNVPILLALRQILQYACDRVEYVLDDSDEDD